MHNIPDKLINLFQMRINIKWFPGFKLILSFILISTSGYSQVSYDSLKKGFSNPSASSKPRTWWHWTNSNITLDGITKDLEWMKRSGIGGMQLADVAAGQGQVTDKKIIFRSEEWLDAVKHAASEAKRLGLEMAIFSSAGWSLAGGPWMKDSFFIHQPTSHWIPNLAIQWWVLI